MPRVPLPPPPRAGQGLHSWILEFTRRRVMAGLKPEAIARATWELTRDRGRPEAVLRNEIAVAIAGALEWLKKHPQMRGNPPEGTFTRTVFVYPTPSVGIPRCPPKSWIRARDEKLIRRVLGGRVKDSIGKEDFDLGDLYANLNFPICATHDNRDTHIRRLRAWQERGTDRLQLLSPNPFQRCGEGKGLKTHKNAGSRIWLVIEFDKGSQEEQLKLLHWLGSQEEQWKLALAIYSGGKSVHGWFSCVGYLDKVVRRFFHLGQRLGSDVMMRDSIQYTRMPNGWNYDKKRRQSILHWDEAALEEHTTRLYETYRQTT